MPKLQSAVTELTVLSAPSQLVHIDRPLSPEPFRRVVGLIIPSYDPEKDPLEFRLPSALMPDIDTVSEQRYTIPREIASRLGQFFIRHYTGTRTHAQTRSGCMVVYALAHGIYERNPAVPTALVVANEGRRSYRRTRVGDVKIFKSPESRYHCGTVLATKSKKYPELELLQMTCPGGDLAITTLKQAQANCRHGVFGDTLPDAATNLSPNKAYLSALSKTALRLRCDFPRASSYQWTRTFRRGTSRGLF